MKTASSAFLLFIFSSFILSFTTSVFGDCGQQTSCAQCSGMDGCGWCDTGAGPGPESVCLSGDQNGPTGRCPNPNSVWRYSTCSDNEFCNTHTECDDCLEHPQCGWCDNVCVAATASGPISPPHTCNVFLYGTQSCDANCMMYTTCDACTEAESECGWCSLTSTCLPMTEIGQPLNATCPAKNWTIYDHDCPLHPTNCSSFTDCQTCISSDVDCGWCNTTGMCVDQTTSNCSIIKDWSTSCMDPGGGCAQYRNCTTCTANSKCGFCGNMCLEGGASGPSPNYTCQNPWLYQTCNINCTTSYSDCNSCINTAGLCGWCSGTSTCLNAGSNCTTQLDFDQMTCPPNCSQYSDCKDCGEYDERCAWCYWENNSMLNGTCLFPSPENFKTIPLSSTCKSECNGRTVRYPHLPRGAVAGIIIGSLVAIILALSLAVFFYRKYKRSTFEVI